jgi:hypothetical protein
MVRVEAVDHQGVVGAKSADLLGPAAGDAALHLD